MPLGVWRLKVFLTSYLLPIVGGGLGLHGTWLGNSKELLGSQFVAGVWPSHYSVVWLFCSIPTVSSRPAPPTSITHLTGGHLYHIYIMLLLLLCIKLILQCNVLSIIFAKKKQLLMDILKDLFNATMNMFSMYAVWDPPLAVSSPHINTISGWWMMVDLWKIFSFIIPRVAAVRGGV